MESPTKQEPSSNSDSTRKSRTTLTGTSRRGLICGYTQIVRVQPMRTGMVWQFSCSTNNQCSAAHAHGDGLVVDKQAEP